MTQPLADRAAEMVKRLEEGVVSRGDHSKWEIDEADETMGEAATLIADLLKAAETARRDAFNFQNHLQRQRDWSEKTFGPGPRTAGVVDHIRKELAEIEADPSDISEWIDVVILGLDGAWRAGHSPQQIIDALVAKQTKNEGRSWPDWRTAPPDKAIEHDRGSGCPHCGFRHPPDGMCLT